MKYIGLSGMTTGDVAINLSCSDSVGCTDILMDTVNIVGATASVKESSFCKNASVKESSFFINLAFLLPIYLSIHLSTVFYFGGQKR